MTIIKTFVNVKQKTLPMICQTCLSKRKIECTTSNHLNKSFLFAKYTVVVNKVSLFFKGNNLCICKQDKKWCIYCYGFDLFSLKVIEIYTLRVFIIQKRRKMKKTLQKLQTRQEFKKNVKKLFFASICPTSDRAYHSVLH